MNNILPSWADTARGAEAPGYGWVLVDMKGDWKTVFPQYWNKATWT